MDLRNLVDLIASIGIVAVWIVDVLGWWITLITWVIPTLSITVGNIFTSLSLWEIVAVLLFFVVWMPLMILGAILAILVLLD